MNGIILTLIPAAFAFVGEIVAAVLGEKMSDKKK